MEPRSGQMLGGSLNLDIQGLLREFLEIAICRKWLIVSCVAVSVSVSAVFAWFKQDVYRSSTVILVEHQKIPENYVRSVVGGSVAERVSTITQQVLSRTNLQKVIEEFDLFPGADSSKGYESQIGSLRNNVILETQGNRGRVEAFTISFSHPDPVTAMNVAAKLASQYIEENLKIREQFVEGASEFLEKELQIAKATLDEKEKVLSEFKLRYMGELPGQLESNLRALDRLQIEKTTLQESLNTLTLRLEQIQKTLHDYEALGGLQNPVMPGLTIRPLPVDPLAAKLEELERELVRLSVEYTESYPDVITLKSRIDQLKEEIAARRIHEEEATHDRELNELGSSESTPAKKFDPYLQNLQSTEVEIKAQIASVKKRQKRIVREMEKFQNRIERTPAREQELLILERDYANMQQNYQALHGKRLSSRISENLEKRQKAERFRVLDPANLPTIPEGFSRTLIVLVGLVVGCGIGFGSAFGLEILWNPTFRRSEDAELSLGFPILATIPSFLIAYGKSLPGLPVPSSAKGNGFHEKTIQKAGYLLGETDVKKKKHKILPANKELAPQLGLVSKWRPRSIVAEQYRVAATRLSLIKADHTVFLVTSAMKGEGKTSTAANLAYTLARDLEEPTLVIDCDFKCPSLHEVLSISSDPGLIEYLYGEEPLESCLHRFESLPLWILPIGNFEENAVPLSKLPQISSVIDTLKPRFRNIILDAPPILPLADINVLMGLADVLLLVVRSGTTPKDVVLKSMYMLKPTVQSRIVLTDAWSEGMPYYLRQGYEVSYAIGERG